MVSEFSEASIVSITDLVVSLFEPGLSNTNGTENFASLPKGICVIFEPPKAKEAQQTDFCTHLLVRIFEAVGRDSSADEVNGSDLTPNGKYRWAPLLCRYHAM